MTPDPTPPAPDKMTFTSTVGNCPDCGGPIAIRNPTGKCDHLYYPENKPKKQPAPGEVRHCEGCTGECRAFCAGDPCVHECPGLRVPDAAAIREEGRRAGMEEAARCVERTKNSCADRRDIAAEIRSRASAPQAAPHSERTTP